MSALVKGDVSRVMAKETLNTEPAAIVDTEIESTAIDPSSRTTAERLPDSQGDHFLRPCLSRSESSPEGRSRFFQTDEVPGNMNCSQDTGKHI